MSPLTASPISCFCLCLEEDEFVTLTMKFTLTIVMRLFETSLLLWLQSGLESGESFIQGEFVPAIGVLSSRKRGCLLTFP